MVTYLDSSVLLRVLLDQEPKLAGWRSIEGPITNELTEVECFRTLDRFRLVRRLSAPRIAELQAAAYEILQTVEIVALARSILRRAAQPFPTPLGSLDAIHLSTALVWRERNDEEVVLATHDAALGLGARAAGLHVIGL